MAKNLRTPYQGVWNIVRFNWHFYLLAAALIGLLLIIAASITPPVATLLQAAAMLAAGSTIFSLLVSYYIYDRSNLYELHWLNKLTIPKGATIINIHAGFDETSQTIAATFSNATLLVYDFYHPLTHTEVSIRRARKAYPPYPGTVSIPAQVLPLANASADCITLIFAAHEIRNTEERIQFFKELKRCLKPGGTILVTEHLRNLPNFIAYNIGFLHFYPSHEWHKTFTGASLKLVHTIAANRFITTFILQ